MSRGFSISFLDVLSLGLVGVIIIYAIIADTSFELAEEASTNLLIIEHSTASGQNYLDYAKILGIDQPVNLNRKVALTKTIEDELKAMGLLMKVSNQVVTDEPRILSFGNKAVNTPITIELFFRSKFAPHSYNISYTLINSDLSVPVIRANKPIKTRTHRVVINFDPKDPQVSVNL